MMTLTRTTKHVQTIFRRRPTIVVYTLASAFNSQNVEKKTQPELPLPCTLYICFYYFLLLFFVCLFVLLPYALHLFTNQHSLIIIFIVIIITIIIWFLPHLSDSWLAVIVVFRDDFIIFVHSRWFRSECGFNYCRETLTLWIHTHAHTLKLQCRQFLYSVSIDFNMRWSAFGHTHLLLR